MKLYVSGPMSGLPGYNFAAFDAATAALDFLGHEVVSPAEHDRELFPGIDATPECIAGAPLAGVEYANVLGWDFKQIVDCDGIVLIPGWEASVGANAELFVARMTGKRVFHLVTDNGGGVGLPWVEDADLRLIELPRPVIIGLSGYAQTGKDTAALTLTALGFVRLSFADSVREAVYVLNPKIKVKGHYTDLQTHVDKVGWEVAKKLPVVRALLQRMGTEVGRTIIDDDAWVNIMRRHIEGTYNGFDDTPEPARFVFSDVRFENEAKLIKDLGGEVWRIERAGYGPINDHISEVGLDDWPFDARIVNDGGDLTNYTNVVAQAAAMRGALDPDTTARLLAFFAEDDLDAVAGVEPIRPELVVVEAFAKARTGNPPALDTP